MVKLFNGTKPTIYETCYIAENAYVIGDVQIGSNSLIWFGAVVREYEDSIYIGENSNT